MLIISAKKLHHSFHNTPPSSREETSQLFVKQSIHLAVGNHAIESPSQDRNLIKMIEPFKQNHWIIAYQWWLLFHKLIVCNILMSTKIKHSSLWHAVPEKTNNFFEQKIFFVQHQLFLLTWNTFSCKITLFLSTSEYFLCNSKLLFRYKIVFRATTNFSFGHCLECYVMVIYFYCHVATKK